MKHRCRDSLPTFNFSAFNLLEFLEFEFELINIVTLNYEHSNTSLASSTLSGRGTHSGAPVVALRAETVLVALARKSCPSPPRAGLRWTCWRRRQWHMTAAASGDRAQGSEVSKARCIFRRSSVELARRRDGGHDSWRGQAATLRFIARGVPRLGELCQCVLGHDTRIVVVVACRHQEADTRHRGRGRDQRV